MPIESNCIYRSLSQLFPKQFHDALLEICTNNGIVGTDGLAVSAQGVMDSLEIRGICTPSFPLFIKPQTIIDRNWLNDLLINQNVALVINEWSEQGEEKIGHMEVFAPADQDKNHEQRLEWTVGLMQRYGGRIYTITFTHPNCITYTQ